MIPRQQPALRVFLAVFSLAGLMVVFLFQQYDYSQWFWWTNFEGTPRFIVNRLARFLINDLLMVLLIFSIFFERKYVIMAFIVQAGGLVLILTPYLLMQVYLPHIGGPMVSYLHRLTVNPLLMLVLIPAFWYQKKMRMKG